MICQFEEVPAMLYVGVFIVAFTGGFIWALSMNRAVQRGNGETR